MKRVILNGTTVVNVEVVADGETHGMVVKDDLYVGPGCEWNGNSKTPRFTAPPSPAAEPDPLVSLNLGLGIKL